MLTASFFDIHFSLLLFFCVIVVYYTKLFDLGMGERSAGLSHTSFTVLVQFVDAAHYGWRDGWGRMGGGGQNAF